LDEIDKVNAILNAQGHTGREEQYVKQFGLRINPVVIGGSIASTSTATTLDSKFGLALLTDNDNTTKERLMALYRNNPWLQGVHVHVGSQGCSLDMLVTGAKRVVEFALAVNDALGQRQIQVIDIGVYDGNAKEAYRFEEYVNALNQHVPLLFTSGYFTVITEFGRSILVKCGITISRVETVKNWLLKSGSCGNNGNNNDRQPAAARIVVIHVGANQFLRTAYLPNEWKHCFSVFDPNGNPKGCDDENDDDDDDHVVPFLLHDIAGPMCFSGDYLAKGIWLPEIKAGDYLVIHDTGGYTMSMYSRYNSRCASGIYGYEYEGSNSSSNNIQLSILKMPETVDEALSFWGLEKPMAI
jgi:diaminopimelate decarboxylase